MENLFLLKTVICTIQHNAFVPTDDDKNMTLRDDKVYYVLNLSSYG